MTAELSEEQEVQEPKNRWKSTSKGAKKVAENKAEEGMDPLPAAIPATVGSSKRASSKVANGEHISTIVQECLK